MLLGKVIGNVWGNKVDKGMESRKLLIIESIGKTYPSICGNHIVAADTTGASIGDFVIVAFGSPARTSYGEGENTPFMTSVMGIVDNAEILASECTSGASFLSKI